MKRPLQIYYLCLIALAGFLACPAMPMYAAAVVVAIALALIAYRKMRLRSSRLLLLALCVIDAIVGATLGAVFHGPQGVAGHGVLGLVVAWIINTYIVFSLYEKEAAADRNDAI